MNTESSIAYSKTTNPRAKEMSKVKKIGKNQFNFYGKGASWGVQAGALMGLYLLLVGMGGSESSIGLKFLKYGFLAFFLVRGLSVYQDYIQSNRIFRNGILLAAVISAVSAITLIVINGLAFIGGSELAFMKFGVDSDTTLNFASVSSIIFFEVFVFGMIISFIVLQYLKTRFRPNEGILEESGNVEKGYNQK